MEALLLKHIRRDMGNTSPSRDTRHRRALLQARLDGVDWRVGQRTHGAGDQADEGGLVGGQLGRWVDLVGLEDLLEFGVGGEVDGLVGSCSGG